MCETSKTTGEALDFQATILDFASYYARSGGHVVGLTAAIARGWSCAQLAGRVYVSQPAYAPPAIGLHVRVEPFRKDRVEVRRDQRGREYRISDPVCTVIDCIENDEIYTQTHVEEVVVEALHDGVDVASLRHLASARGLSDRLESYLRRAGDD